MRLLQLAANGALSLTSDLLQNIPPYAILSHRWGADEDEVLLQDVMQSTGKHKTGYQKLLFCAKQAAADGLQYFWVDTCCIDKSNSTELSEAINSMFRWYQNAEKCYVFLADVSAIGPGADKQSWEPALRGSQWFTRGWTLQELVAPKSVLFFSHEGHYLGDKKSLESLIHEVTAVPTDALQGRPLSEYSVEERFAWLGTRETKRPEDRAYA